MNIDPLTVIAVLMLIWVIYGSKDDGGE